MDTIIPDTRVIHQFYSMKYTDIISKNDTSIYHRES